MANYRSRREKQKLYKRLGLAAAVLVLGAGCSAAVLHRADRGIVRETGGGSGSGQAQETETEETVTYDGKTYVKKGNLETYLFAGIDDAGPVEEITEYDGSGQCDVLWVIVRDRSTDAVSLLSIDRNTMTDVKSLDDEGNYLATSELQLSLAHAMSLDHTLRAENTVDAVSNLLSGQTIDGYAMLNMGAISVANDLVGGVAVTLNTDFTEFDKDMKEGAALTLTGEQAEIYIRSRYALEDDRNELRLERQAVYEEGFQTAFREKCAGDANFPLTFYEALQDYMTTTVGTAKFSKLALLLSDSTEDASYTLEGTYGNDEDGWQTFTPDKDSLQSVILALFYKET